MGSITGRIIIGIVLALMDYYWSKRQRKIHKDQEQAKRCLESMEYVLEHPNEHSSDYARALRDVKYYLASEGYLSSNSLWLKGVIESFTKFSFRERLNNLGLLGLFVAACILEILYDVVFGYYYATSIEGNSSLTVIFSNLIHIPALWVGLLVGRYIRSIVRWMFTDPEELNMHRTIKDLVLSTDILQLVTAEREDAKIESIGLDDLSMRLSSSGKKLMKKIQQGGQQLAQQAKQAVDAVSEYQEKREREIAEEKEKTKTQFEDLTKGR